jgi:D-arabinonate dehydratase
MITQVMTDEGTIGLGTHAHSLPPDIFKAMVETLKPLVLGEDPFYVERIWDRMFRLTFRFGRRGAVIGAMSSIDIALWDIIGKSVGEPLYRLLGAYCDKVPVYASGGYFREHDDVENLVRDVTDWVKKGYTIVKFKVGALSIEHDIARVKAVREAVGPDVRIIVDSIGGYPNPFTAIKVAKRLEKYDIYWFEEPLQADDVEGLAEVRRAVGIPIASGETQFTRYGFKDLIVKRAVDIIQPDAGICGGITEFRKIASMAAAYDMPIAPHRSTEVNIHLLASVPNGLTVESFPLETVLWDEIFLDPIEVKNGYIQLPSKPGLGIELNKKAIEKYEIKSS